MKPLRETGIARLGAAVLPCAAMLLATGCVARVAPAPVTIQPAGVVVEDEIVYGAVVPPNIEVYPRYYYNGGYAYYVEGRWYRQGPRGWGYYRRVPPPLARWRPPPPAYWHRPGVVERQPPGWDHRYEHHR